MEEENSARRWCAKKCFWFRNEQQEETSSVRTQSGVKFYFRDLFLIRKQISSGLNWNAWTAQPTWWLVPDMFTSTIISTLSIHCLRHSPSNNFHSFRQFSSFYSRSSCKAFLHLSRMFVSIVCLTLRVCLSVGRHRVRTKHYNKEIYERLFVSWQRLNSRDFSFERSPRSRARELNKRKKQQSHHQLHINKHMWKATNDDC